MRILHLIASEKLYGSGRVVIELSKALLMVHNCQPVIGLLKNRADPDDDLTNEARENGINVTAFPLRNRLDLRTVFLIRKYVKDNKINLIHCHGYKDNFYCLLAHQKKTQIVSTNHNWLKSHWKTKIYCLLDAFLIRYFDRIVAVSHDIKQDMMRYKIPERKIEVIDNGIDLGRFKEEIPNAAIKQEFRITGDDKVIGTVGNLRYEKGHIYLLRAAKEIIENHKHIKFIIIGDGPLKKYLENEISKLGIEDNIILTGYRKDIVELLSVMDIFVLPSLIEGLPMVLLEAMAARKPVIATRVGAISKLIRNYENGILIKPENTKELISSIEFLIKDRKKMLQLANSGYLTVKNSYSSEKMCNNYILLYKKLISKNS